LLFFFKVWFNSDVCPFCLITCFLATNEVRSSDEGERIFTSRNTHFLLFSALLERKACLLFFILCVTSVARPSITHLTSTFASAHAHSARAATTRVYYVHFCVSRRFNFHSGGFEKLVVLERCGVSYGRNLVQGVGIYLLSSFLFWRFRPVLHVRRLSGLQLSDIVESTKCLVKKNRGESLYFGASFSSSWSRSSRVDVECPWNRAAYL